MKYKSLFLLNILFFCLIIDLRTEPSCQDYKVGYFVFLGVAALHITYTIVKCIYGRRQVPQQPANREPLV